MTPPPVSELPLYQLACRSDPHPTGLQLSPMIFKSIVSSIVDLLSEQVVPAIVWAKLPRGEVWQAELDRIAQSSHPPQIYVFQNQRDSDGSPSPVQGISLPTPETFPVLLHANSPLRREYFLIVWSGQMQVALVAHRLRLTQPPKPLASSMDSVSGLLERQDENSDSKQQLLSLCTFDADLVEQMVAEIAIAIAPLSSNSEAIDPEFTCLNDWASRWQQQIADLPATANSPDNLLSKQLQKQEETWQRSTVYRKQAEVAETLQLQNAALIDTVRLRDDFLNNVGQELRTPLTTIKTALKLLNSPNLKPPQRQRYLDLIEQECDRQSSLITRLLELVQLDQMADQNPVQSLHLSEVVPGVVSTYQPLAEEKGVRLTYAVPDDLPPIACVNNWLKQIVINLLHNGIKFTPTGGQVWVRAKTHGKHVQLEFRDTGAGIAPSEIPKIFDRFYRGRPSSEDATSSTGLGLTIVQQLLIHCGGTISVQSKLGEGSTFNVLLPIYQNAESATRKP